MWKSGCMYRDSQGMEMQRDNMSTEFEGDDNIGIYSGRANPEHTMKAVLYQISTRSISVSVSVSISSSAASLVPILEDYPVDKISWIWIDCYCQNYSK